MAEFPPPAALLVRTGLDGLARHLASTYGVTVAGTTALDVGVFQLDLAPGSAAEPTPHRWVARVFPSARPRAAAEGDAEVLRLLERGGFPAERIATDQPVSMLADQPVLVTTFVDGRRARPTPGTLVRLGAMLAHLHAATASSPSVTWPGGAWHHLVPAGGPSAEVDAIRAAIEAAGRGLAARDRAGYEAVLQLAGSLEVGAGLPQALLHPDFVPANAIEAASPEAPGGRRLVVVDWSGAGRGPRLLALGPLLWAAGARDLDRVASVAAGYRTQVGLEAAELDRLPGAIATRWVVLDCWAWCVGRIGLGELRQRLPRTVKLAEAIGARARSALS